MFCPRCQAEYRFGFTRCSDCDVDLVDSLPKDAPSSITEIPSSFEAYRFEAKPELVVIRTFQSGVDADFAKSALESAGIPAMVRGNDTVRRHYYAVPLGGIELLVRAEDAEDADKILDVDAAGEGTEPI